MNRVILADALPLSAPLVVQIFPEYACNLKCKYCHFTVPKGQRHFVSDQQSMHSIAFFRMVKGMHGFPVKPRVLRFVGIGEPLLHPNIVEFVWFADTEAVAETTEVLTNGILLTEGRAYELMQARLSKLVVSIQGTSPEKYKEMCGVPFDPRKIADTLKYVMANRHRFGGSFKIHVKIMDIALDGPEDYECFKDMFSQVCDTMAVENAGPIYPQVEFNASVPRTAMNQYGHPAARVLVCPQAFTSLQVNPDGKVVPCYSAQYPEIIGDVNHETLPEIWNGERLRQFRLRSLEGRTGVCADCQIIDHRMYQQDDISGVVDRLKGVYGCL